jgi:RNA-binding protein NOB1
MSRTNPTYASVVLDANAFITGSASSLRSLATAHYTTSAVVSEIRDARARALLSTLPFELKTRMPAEEDVNAVRLFAGATGDLRALSRTDVTLLALARTLEREANGMVYLRTEPPKNVTIADAPRAVVAKMIGGAANEAGGAGEDVEMSSQPPPAGGASSAAASGAAAGGVGSHVGASRGWNEGVEDVADEGEWAGPAEEGGAPVVEELRNAEAPARVGVGLLTTDFAMQNVALQMGIVLLTHSGLAVASVKSWVLKCDGCFSIFPMHGLRPEEWLFCKRCGNASLARLGVTLGPDGAPRYHYKRFRQINTRGTIYALPAPKGGRVHGAHKVEKKPLLLRPDQLLTGGWKERQRLAQRAERDAFGEEGAAPESAVASGGGRGWGAWTGPASGAAPPSLDSVQVGYGRRNPNAVGRRKK